MSVPPKREDALIREFRTDLRLIQEDTTLPLEQLGELKNDLMHLLPQMRTLAKKGVAKAQFYLALAFDENSKEYLNWMKEASNHGVVDAHFALGQLYLKQGDLSKSVASFKRVLSSNDAFLKDEVKEIMHNSPALAYQLTTQGKSRHGFFKPTRCEPLKQSKGQKLSENSECITSRKPL